MEKFYNIDEQRLWNMDSNWEVDGHEWSKSFGTTEDLWNSQIFDRIKDFRGKKINESPEKKTEQKHIINEKKKESEKINELSEKIDIQMNEISSDEDSMSIPDIN